MGVGLRRPAVIFRFFSSLYFIRRQLVMARKVVNRKELRKEAEAAEKAEKSAATKKKVAKKPAKKRASRAKVAKEVRLKAFWGIFNQSMKRVAIFEYSQRKQADKKVKELNAKGKAPHFVQLVKEVIEPE